MKFPVADRMQWRPDPDQTYLRGVPWRALWTAHRTAHHHFGKTRRAALWGVLRAPLLLFAALATAAPIFAPGFENEHLHYNINWPSGLSLGEAQLSATTSKSAGDTAPRLHFSFDLDAGIPGFTVTDRYRSEATNDLCSTEFQRNIKHGAKALDEKMTFDPHDGKVTRQPTGGAQTEVSASPCAKDALTFLYYVRRELSQGRIPGPQTIFFGPQYQVHLEFAGTQTVQIGEKPVEADRVKASVQGPVAAISFEIFFMKDPARTPVLVRVPLSMGTFSMELAE
jgi:hypothetical protein